MGKNREALTKYAWLSVAAAVVTIGLKGVAYGLTGSVGLLADALESGVNLLTAVAALVTLIVAAMPPDAEHAYGHSKAEYFSCGFNGALIFLAAVGIGYAAVERWLNPQPLEALSVGLIISVVAAVVNLSVSQILMRAGRTHHSVSLTAEGQHLMTDVWTSVGVLMGVALVWVTGRPWLDVLVALAVAVQVGWSGIRLMKESVHGLMDHGLPEKELDEIVGILEHYREMEGVDYHALRTRRAGAQRFVSVHVQVPGEWSVQAGHDLMEEIEADMRMVVPQLSAFTHLEPLEDPRSWHDIELQRPVGHHG